MIKVRERVGYWFRCRAIKDDRWTIWMRCSAAEFQQIRDEGPKFGPFYYEVHKNDTGVNPNDSSPLF